MKFRTYMMAASALVMIQAAPAYAACQDEIAAVRAEAGNAIVSESTAQKLEGKLAEARNAAEADNDSLCTNIVADIRNELATPDLTLAQLTPGEEKIAMGGDTGGGTTGMQGGATGDTGTTGGTDDFGTTDDFGAADDFGTTGETDDFGATGDVTGDTGTTGDTAGATGLEGDTTGTAGIEGQMDTGTDMQMGADQTTQTQTNLTVSQVQGVSATNRNGETLGQVESVVRDRATGEPYVVISSNGFLGMGGDETAVPMSLVTLNQDGAILDLASETELQTYEPFTEDRYEIVAEETTLSELQTQ